MKQEIEIPEGYEAKIEGSKVVFELKESEDERIRKHIINILDSLAPCHWDGNEKVKCIAYLEKQKPLSTEETELNSIAFLEQLGYTCVPSGGEQKPAEWSEGVRRIVELKTFIAQCNGFNKENRKKAFDMIDALRPQPHWKPSKEHFQGLRRAIIKAEKGSDAWNSLTDLYEHLKKL